MHGRFGTFRALLGNRSLGIGLLAYLLFNLTELGTWVAVLVWGYANGGADEAGLMAVVQLIPAALLAPAGAMALSRLTHARALRIGYLMQGLAFASAGILMIQGAHHTLIVLFAVAGAVSISLTRPVHFALLPLICQTTPELTAATSLSGVAEGFAAFAGPLGSGLLTGSLGPGWVLTLGGLVSLGAATATGWMSTHGDSAQWLVEGRPTTPAQLARVLRRPGVVPLLGTVGLGFAVTGLMDVLLVVLALAVLGLGISGPGLLNSALGLGMVIGAAAAAMVVGRPRLAGVIAATALTLFLALAALSLTHLVLLTVVLVIVVGASRSCFDVAARTLTLRSLPDELLAAVFSLQESMLMLGLCVGSALAPLLTRQFGNHNAFTAAGVGFVIVLSLIASKLLPLDRRTQLPQAEFELLTRVPLFRRLPLRVVEQLARSAVTVDVEPGVAVVVQGDLGNAFYVIRSGEVDVEVSGSLVRTLGPGDWFGELALLRNTVRSATVTARGALSLLEIDRVPFLMAVTGSPPVREALAEHGDSYH